MVWALTRLYGYELTRSDDDLRTAFGLFTRIEATIPLHRIQTLTIEEGPLHRLFKRVGVKVETAGGGTGATAGRRRPIGRGSRRFSGLLIYRRCYTRCSRKSISPALNGKAFMRARSVARSGSLLMFGVPAAGALVMVLNWWTPALVAAVVVWALIYSRQYVRRTGWAMTRHAPSSFAAAGSGGASPSPRSPKFKPLPCANRRSIVDGVWRPSRSTRQARGGIGWPSRFWLVRPPASCTRSLAAEGQSNASSEWSRW